MCTALINRQITGSQKNREYKRPSAHLVLSGGCSSPSIHCRLCQARRHTRLWGLGNYGKRGKGCFKTKACTRSEACLHTRACTELSTEGLRPHHLTGPILLLNHALIHFLEEGASPGTAELIF